MLYRYELKKLLLTPKRLAVLLAFLLLFIALGFESGISSLQHVRSANFDQYRRIVAANTGPINPEELAESTAIVEPYVNQHRDADVELRLRNDPVFDFHYDYVDFGRRVDEYWNGPPAQDRNDIRGIHPIEERLAALQSQGRAKSYEYRYYRTRLDTERALGAPVYAEISFWKNFFAAFEAGRVGLILLLGIPFIISRLFTQEIKTQMDSVVLSSAGGRREIVTAKLLAAASVSAIIAVSYFVGTFIGNCIAFRDLTGFGAPVRCMWLFEATTLRLSVGSAALLGVAWVTLAAVLFGLAVALISAAVKTQSAAFAVALMIILACAVLLLTTRDIRAKLWPVTDFNFVTLTLVGTVFGSPKAYDILGDPVPYGFVALGVAVILAAMITFSVYILQRRRSVK